MEIYKQAIVRKLVLALSKLAKVTLSKGEVLLNMEELSNEIDVDLLERSGILSRVKTISGNKVQFSHMLMQEFLTAIYFIVNPDIPSLIELEGAVYLYAGLAGACQKNSNSSKDLQLFVNALEICGEELYKDFFLSYKDNIYYSEDDDKFLLQCIYEYQNFNNELSETAELVRNHCQRRQLYLKQKETRSSTTQLMYFFKTTKQTFRECIYKLEIVQSIRTEDANIIAEHVCSIRQIHLLISYMYYEHSLSVLISAMRGCPRDSRIKILVISYALYKRHIEYIPANEMAIRYLYRIPVIWWNFHTNVNRGMKLLRENIIHHHNLFDYGLHVLLVTTLSLIHI